MKQYDVTGMACAACSARVEKAVSKVPGVTSCSVNLLTNSMGVEGTATDSQIIDAVVAAGYGASVKGGADQGTSDQDTSVHRASDQKEPSLKKRLISSIILLFSL